MPACIIGNVVCCNEINKSQVPLGPPQTEPLMRLTRLRCNNSIITRVRCWKQMSSHCWSWVNFEMDPYCCETDHKMRLHTHWPSTDWWFPHGFYSDSSLSWIEETMREGRTCRMTHYSRVKPQAKPQSTSQQNNYINQLWHLPLRMVQFIGTQALGTMSLVSRT